MLAAAILVTAFVHRGIEVNQLSRSVGSIDAAMTTSLKLTS